jgi:hypothetical protein
MMKKTHALLLALAMVVGLAPATLQGAKAATGLVDEGYIPPDLPIQGSVNVNFKDGRFQTFDTGAPYLMWSNGGFTSRGIEQALLCDSIDDAKCKQVGGYFEFFTRLVACTTAEALDCIEGITAESSRGTAQGEFVESFPKKIRTTYTANFAARLPVASSAGFWKFANVEHPGGNQFFVDAMLRGRMKAGETTFTNSSLNIAVFAASKKPLGVHQASPDVGGGIDDGSSYVIQRNGSTPADAYFGAVGIYGGYEGETLDCVMSGDSLCANRHAIPDGVKFTVKLRLSSSPTGWLHGRLDQPNVEIVSLPQSPGISLSISGATTRVPAVGKMSNWVDLPQTLRDKYLQGGFAGTKYGCRWCSTDPLKNTLTANPSVSGVGAMEELKAWLPLVNDKSSADLNTWSIRSLSATEMNGADLCFTKNNQINGLLMTNATVYSAGPPQYSDGTLDYQVAAPHLMSNGDVFKGQYNLVIRSEVARCIYKFTSAPIQASVSIVNSSGVSELATMVMGERAGWLYLNASNFEFSSPTLKVKLTQEKAAEATATPTPTPVATVKPVAKKVTITCKKGKTTKKVTAVKPKCPSGFKKSA